MDMDLARKSTVLHASNCSFHCVRELGKATVRLPYAHVLLALPPTIVIGRTTEIACFISQTPNARTNVLLHLQIGLGPMIHAPPSNVAALE